MRKKRVFVSFDFDNDLSLKERLIGQSNLEGSRFEVTGHSLNEITPHSNWVIMSTNAIRRSEIIIVIAGSKTHRASRVLKELAIAWREGKRVVQIAGHKNALCLSVAGAGFMYEWSWANLNKLVSNPECF
jgi:hypothetical protein